METYEIQDQIDKILKRFVPTTLSHETIVDILFLLQNMNEHISNIEERLDKLDPPKDECEPSALQRDNPGDY